MKSKYLKIFLSVQLMLFFMHVQGTTPVQGDGSVPNTFSVPITSQVYNRASGVWYVGLAAPTGNPAFSLAQIPRDSGYVIPKFTGFANNTLVNGKSIELLALATNRGNPQATLGVVVENNGTPQTQTMVISSSTTGNIVQQSANLLDASGTINISGSVTSGIVGLSANAQFLFAAVKPTGGLNFGADPDGGIAVVAINQPALTLTQVAAVPGDSGIKAQEVDQTIPEVGFGTDQPTIVPNQVLLTWDDPLQRLFIGLQLATGPTAGDGALSVIVASVSATGALTLYNIAPDGAFSAANQTNIVGVITPTGTLNLSTQQMQVMHTSTGASYLIVNGGNDIAANVGNQIYALPLVDVGNPGNPTQGTLAAVNTINTTTHRFETPATSNAQLPTSTEQAVAVGNGPIFLAAGELLSDMVVVGDTVYLSTMPTSTTTTPAPPSNGIFYSQAMFDQNGAVVRWTPWTKRGVPFDPSQAAPTTFFQVDAVNGKIWSTIGTQTVVDLSWDNGSSTTSLTTVLDPTMTNGCFSVLDLDQSTRGLGAAAPGRYALFGGTSVVSFALTSTSTNTMVPYDVDGSGNMVSQDAILDYTNPQNFLQTQLPLNAGAVKVLEYSRQLAFAGNTSGYFFAGTDNGLYAFTNGAGQGFDLTATPLGVLNALPFSTGNWQQILGIAGSVIDVKTSGQTLYVMTLQTSPSTPIMSQLYRIDFTNNINTMFAAGNVLLLAQSLVFEPNSDLSQALIFLGMRIISTGDDEEQLVIATNNGMYRSNATEPTGISSAINQATALWSPVDPTDTTMYYAVGGMDALPLITSMNAYRQQSTNWPVSIVDNLCMQNVFNNGGVRQLNGTLNASPFNYVPQQFNAINADVNPALSRFFPTTYFWSDGARRFFVSELLSHSPKRQGALLVSPYDTIEWNVTDPRNQLLNDKVLVNNNSTFFYWAKQIGMTGTILAGTSTGVVALE